MKKMIAMIAALMMVASLSTAAFAGSFEGEVVKVKGDKVTIEITKGKASKIEVGSSVELEVEAPAEDEGGGEDMLMGC